MDTTEAISRSYRARKSIRAGERIVVRDDTYHRGPIRKGTEGKVLGFSNGGFRGIEATIWLDDAQRTATVSAGLLVPAWAW